MRLSQPFVRLPLTVDAARLAREVATIPESAWRGHPEAAPGNTAVVLIGVAGDPDGDSTVGPMAPTPHLDALPSVRQLLAALGTTVGRTRLMRIATETELGLHVDTNYYWWHHLRIHVPVQTTPDVVFQAGTETVHMAAGEVWVFDTWQRHRVDNPAASPRIHLVIDAVGSAPLWDLVERPDREPRHLGDVDTPDTPGTAAELPIEQWNWPVVMAPAEVDATVAALLGDLRVVDPTPPIEPTAPRAVPSRLARPHRSLRPRPCGLATAARAARSHPGRVHAELAGCTLVNGVALTHALDQLVFSPALTPGLAGAASAPGPPAAPARPRTSRPSLLDGPPRIVDPVFVVCPPRSGSSLLFETLQRSPSLATIGGESHEVIEGIAALAPAAHDWDSNRLDATDATDGVVAHLKERFAARMRTARASRAAARPVSSRRRRRTRCASRSSPTRSPTRGSSSSTATRARPSRACSTRGGRRSSSPIATSPAGTARRGRCCSPRAGATWPTARSGTWCRGSGPTPSTPCSTTSTALDGDRWCVASYDQLVADPFAEIQRLCAFLDIDWDDDLAEPLPHSRHTLDSPHPDKWRRNADELAPFVATVVAPAATRALEVFASAPRTDPVPIDDSADRRPVRRHATPPSRRRRARRLGGLGGDVGLGRDTAQGGAVGAGAVRLAAQRLVPRVAPGRRGVARRHHVPGRTRRDGRATPVTASTRTSARCPRRWGWRTTGATSPSARAPRSWCSRTSRR